jgi:ABC-type phosphate transport system substrate-binding protein
MKTDARQLVRRWKWNVTICAVSLSTAVFTGISQGEHSKANYAGSFVDTGLAPYTLDHQVAGRMTIAGSDTMQPLLSKLANEFVLGSAGTTSA